LKVAGNYDGNLSPLLKTEHGAPGMSNRRQIFTKRRVSIKHLGFEVRDLINARSIY